MYGCLINKPAGIKPLFSELETPISPPTSENRFTNVRLSVRVGGLIGPASALKDGLLSHILYQNLFSSKTDSTEDMDLIGTGYYAIHSDYNIPKNNKSGIKYGSFISFGTPVGGNAAGGNAQIQIAIGNDGTRRIRNRWLNNWTEWVTF